MEQCLLLLQHPIQMLLLVASEGCLDHVGQLPLLVILEAHHLGNKELPIGSLGHNGQQHPKDLDNLVPILVLGDLQQVEVLLLEPLLEYLLVVVLEGSAQELQVAEGGGPPVRLHHARTVQLRMLDLAQ